MSFISILYILVDGNKYNDSGSNQDKDYVEVDFLAIRKQNIA